MKRGVSLISVSVMIIVISIITAVIIINSTGYFSEISKTKFVTDFMQVQTATEKYYLNKNVYPVLGEITLEVAPNAQESQFENEELSGNAIVLQKIDVSLLGIDDLTYGTGIDERDFFAVSQNTNEIYYVAGFRYNEKIYYKEF